FDFLERVGWQDEGTAWPLTEKKKDTDKVVTRRDTRKLRASIITDKSKVLGALKNRITKLETEITELEQDLEQEMQILLDASMQGKALIIKKSSITINESRARIDALYNELETVTREHDVKSSEFEKRLNDLLEFT
ncbi:MAG TPA: hypothetical protein VLX29_02475, partial [Nitrospirota bacterium]|nr:hypothetical protein [Nitrospirota bacterium]